MKIAVLINCDQLFTVSEEELETAKKAAKEAAEQAEAAKNEVQAQIERVKKEAQEQIEAVKKTAQEQVESARKEAQEQIERAKREVQDRVESAEKAAQDRAARAEQTAREQAEAAKKEALEQIADAKKEANDFRGEAEVWKQEAEDRVRRRAVAHHAGTQKRAGRAGQRDDDGVRRGRHRRFGQGCPARGGKARQALAHTASAVRDASAAARGDGRHALWCGKGRGKRPHAHKGRRARPRGAPRRDRPPKRGRPPERDDALRS